MYRHIYTDIYIYIFIYPFVCLFVCLFVCFSVLLLMFTGYGAVFMLLFTAAAYGVSCYWSFLFEPLLLKWAPQLHSRDINTDIMPTESDAAAAAAAQQQQQQGGVGGYMQDQQQPPHYINTQSFSNIPGVSAAAAADIPTQYDYSQLQHQVSQGIEMGVVAPQH